MKQDYMIDDYVSYGRDGICRIADTAALKSSADGGPAQYYALKPVYDSAATIYVPLDSNKLVERIRPIPKKSELDSMILASKGNRLQWISDRKARNEHFQSVFSRCDQAELLGLMSCLYLKKLELSAQNKKLSAADYAAFEQAEQLITNEFAFVLKLSGPDEVGEYIRELLGIGEAE